MPTLSDPTFRLLDLPPELRNWIYELVLSQHGDTYDLNDPLPAITQVSRSLRDETLSMWHGQSILTVDRRGNMRDNLGTNTLGSNISTDFADSIRNLVFTKRVGFYPSSSGIWAATRLRPGAKSGKFVVRVEGDQVRAEVHMPPAYSYPNARTIYYGSGDLERIEDCAYDTVNDMIRMTREFLGRELEFKGYRVF